MASPQPTLSRPALPGPCPRWRLPGRLALRPLLKRLALTALALLMGCLLLMAMLTLMGLALQRNVGMALAQGSAAAMPLGGLAELAAGPQLRGLRLIGLEGAPPGMSLEQQLLRQPPGQPLVLRLERDPQRNWGGHALHPELLNVVLLPPGTSPAQGLGSFTLNRSSSPLYRGPALDDPRWQSGQAGEGGRYQWRRIATRDQGAPDGRPRWSLQMLDSSRGVRLDYDVWQSRASADEVLARAAAWLDALRLLPAAAAHWASPQDPAKRDRALREANLQSLRAALAPQGLLLPQDLATRDGWATAPGLALWWQAGPERLGLAAWLAAVPLAAEVPRDPHGRPALPLRLRRGQYPGPTIGDGLPALDQFTLWYWHPASQRWRVTLLQSPTLHEEQPLGPFESAMAAHLDSLPGARGAVHVALQRTAWRTPWLDDAQALPELLQQARHWQAEWLAGRIVAGAQPSPWR